MDKIVVGPAVVGAIDIEAPVQANINSVAKALDKGSEDLTVCILDGLATRDLVAQVRAAGARIKFIGDGDVAGAIMAASPNIGVDIT